MKAFGWALFIGAALIILSFILNMCGDTAKVVQNEYSASAMLKKYEYFKDLSSAIDKKRADIEMYKEQIKEEKNEDEKRQLKAELRGIVTVHNELCSDYNSSMSKFNYRFTNAGDLPATNLTPLPREIKPYIISLN